MSASAAPVPARNSDPVLKIKLRETGGIAGVQRTVALDGNTLRVVDRGLVRVERELPVGVVRAFANLVRALESIQPKRNYGRYRFAADMLTTELEICDDSNGLEVEVVSDPTDPAPPQFWQIVDDLRTWSKADVQSRSFEL